MSPCTSRENRRCRGCGNRVSDLQGRWEGWTAAGGRASSEAARSSRSVSSAPIWSVPFCPGTPPTVRGMGAGSHPKAKHSLSKLSPRGAVSDRLVGQVYKVSRIELFQVGAFDSPASHFDAGELTGMNQTADSRLGQPRVAGSLVARIGMETEFPLSPSGSARRCVRTQAVRARSLCSGLFGRVGSP